MKVRLRWALAGSALAAAAALAVAMGSERFLGLVPCALCLLERWPYRVALVLALGGVLLPRLPALIAAMLVLLSAAAAAVLAALHVGVEQGLWPSPLPECAAPRLATGSIAQRLASMPAHPSKSCEDPTMVLPALHLSMAGANLIYALTFCIILATLLWRRGSRP
jgi:disulfide bond formation protein DsbB